MSQYFPKPSDCFGDNIKVELDSSNYATEADLKGATGVNKLKPHVLTKTRSNTCMMKTGSNL